MNASDESGQVEIMTTQIDKTTMSAQVRAFAKAYPGIAAAYLFGSAATGKMKPGSDLDIALMCTGHIDGFERISMETALSNLLGRDVDLVIFHQAGVLLQHQILKYGCLIYEQHPAERVRQETISRSRYLDTRHLYKRLAV
jgi:predicted nucleotidyltransferase